MGVARLALLLVAPSLCARPGQAAQLAVPKNDGWVTDLAGMLKPEEERSLELLMESYRSGSGHEIALLTVPSLRGEPIERFGLEVGREWGLGRKEENDGALLIVARDERKLRIEVGRGLEGNLTDAICGRIIRDVIAPLLGQGRTAEGLRAGIEATHAAIGGDYGPIEARSRGRSRGLLGLFPLAWLLMLFVVLLRRRRHRGRGLAGSALPWMILGSGSSRDWHSGSGGGSSGGGGFGGFGGGGGFSGGGASGGW